MRIWIATLLLTASAMAQTNRGSLSGTVFDASQAAIAGARVTVTSVGTNEIRKATTSEAGSYSVQSLEPVLYRIEVEAAGFKRKIVDNVKVDTATKPR
jgi:protocatechuate 3,4-dioxygenase beta subunit